MLAATDGIVERGRFGASRGGCPLPRGRHTALL